MKPLNLKAVQAFFGLIRFDYSLFSGFGVFVAGLLARDFIACQLEYALAFFVVFLTAVGSFAFNDYLDVEVDKKNSRKDRPLVLQLLSTKTALVTGVISFLLVVVVSLFLNLAARFFVILSFPLFFLYSLGLKRFFLVKNVLISYAYVAVILLGSIVSDSTVEPLILYFAMMGFIVGLASEIMSDICDVEGDRALGIETFSTKFGVRNAALASTFLYCVIMVLDPLPFFVLIDSALYMDIVFLSLILIPVASYFFISKSLTTDQSRINILKLKKRLFLTMQAGCIVYLFGVWI